MVQVNTRFIHTDFFPINSNFKSNNLQLHCLKMLGKSECFCNISQKNMSLAGNTAPLLNSGKKVWTEAKQCKTIAEVTADLQELTTTRAATNNYFLNKLVNYFLN